MEKHTANSTYSNSEFEELIQDKHNTICFDCGKGPASWASVNNAIYLCINCSSNHRGYGVQISYVRSLTIDTWNETQMGYMKFGGNKRLRDLLNLYEVPNSTPSEFLFITKLLEYHRNQIKQDVSKGKQLIPPKLDEAMQVMDSMKSRENSQSNNNINNNSAGIYSVTSDFEKSSTKKENSGGFFSNFNSIMQSALQTGKYVASNVTDKVKEYEIGNKILNSGAKTVDFVKESSIKGVDFVKETSYKGVDFVKDKSSKGVDFVKDTSSKVVSKGIEVGEKVKEKGTELAQSETVQNLKSKVGTGVNYIYGKFFGSSQNDNETTNSVSNNNTQQLNQNDSEDELKIENQFTYPDLKKD